MRIREERLEDFDRIDAGNAFVAVDDDERVVGHTMLSYAELEEGGRVLQLSPLGVEPDRQRQGFGSALVRHALAAAEELEHPLVVLVGDPRYYGRFGFVPSRELGILAPLSDPSAPWQAGRIRLPPAFDIVA